MSEGSSFGGGGYFPCSHEYVVHSKSDPLHSLPPYLELERVEGEVLPGGAMTYHEREQLSARQKEERSLVSQTRRGQCPVRQKKYQTEGAKLFRKTRGKFELLADVSNMEFEKIEAPYASSVRKWD